MPAAAGPLPLVQRGEDGDREQHAGAGVAERRARPAGPAVRLAGDAHRAATGLRDHVEGEVLLVGAAASEALHLRIDEARIGRLQHLPAEPQPLDRAGREVLDEDIGLLRHRLDELYAARRFQVERHRLLVGIVDHEIVGVGAGLGAASENPARLATHRVLDFDDLGAEQGQDFGAGWAGLELREVEDAYAGEAIRRRLLHARCSFCALPWVG